MKNGSTKYVSHLRLRPEELTTIKRRTVTLPQQQQNDPGASPASASDAPSLWLYKFPPWFFPSNPPPKEFLPKQLQNSESGTSGTKETNAFQTETSGVAHRHARLTRVKVPINSAFRDQVITMVLNAKRDVGKASFSTPLLVPQGAWQPSLSFPQTTSSPSLRDRLTESQPEDKGHSLVSLGLPFTSTSGESLFSSNHRETKPTLTTVQDFQSNPQDLTQARRGSSRDQFRPSKLLSIIALGQDSQFSIRERQHQNINSAFSTVSTSASQKISGVPKRNLHQTTLADIALGLEYPYDRTSLATLPDVTSHLPVVNKNVGKSSEELELRQKSFTWDGFRPLLKSDQDVHSIRKESDPLHSLEHDHQLSFTSRPDDAEFSGQDRKKWFWPIP
ncbi:hypothetical protein E2C01_031646 [Portunus trituberculatus]|uniref:Uncharacterized protein n=1 Tax=Portunus trituberculatus TaxID=210409 RepID=A0A5B7EV85_PORTR|nr:hypothetical protein [Portunus trituberculatus]